MNQVFDASLFTLGAVGISFASKKVLGDTLGVLSTGMGIVKMAAAIASGIMLVQYLQEQKMIPDDPFKQ